MAYGVLQCLAPSLVILVSSYTSYPDPCPHWTWSFLIHIFEWGSGHVTPKTVSWYTEYFKWKESEQTAEARRSDFPSCFSPEADDKALMWDVPSLYPWKRNILVSEMDRHKDESKWMGLVFFSPHLLPLAHIISFTALSYFSIAFHSNLAQKHSGLTTSLGLQFFMKVPSFPYLHQINVCNFLLFIWLCQFNFQAHSGTLTVSKETFSSPRIPIPS